MKYRILWYKSLGIGECINLINGEIKFFTALNIKPLGKCPNVGDVVEFIV